MGANYNLSLEVHDGDSLLLELHSPTKNSLVITCLRYRSIHYIFIPHPTDQPFICSVWRKDIPHPTDQPFICLVWRKERGKKEKCFNQMVELKDSICYESQLLDKNFFLSFLFLSFLPNEKRGEEGGEEKKKE